MHIYKKKHLDFSKAPELRCSFCGKEQIKVKTLVAGPAVYICNDCVAICDEIIADNEACEQLRHRPAGRTPDEGISLCSFCQTVLPAGQMLMVAERGQLCPVCANATRSALKALRVW